MDTNKFDSEVLTVNKFFNMYCSGNKHENSIFRNVKLKFKDKTYDYEIKLCDKCLETVSYSHNRLIDCPQEIKPKCRSCKNPCYDKDKWKAVAKVMRYSGVRLGLTKIKSKIKSIFL